MVEPAGAMALFVLRLTGLLSLENALKDQEANLTSYPAINLTSLGFDETTTNLTWPNPEPQVVSGVSQGGELSSPPSPAVPSSTTSSFVDNSAPSFPTPSTDASTVKTSTLPIVDDSLHHLSTAPTAINHYNTNADRNSDRQSLPTHSNGRYLGERNVRHDAVEVLPTASPLSAARNVTTGGGDVVLHGAVSGRNAEGVHRRRWREGGVETRQYQEVLERALQENLRGDGAGGRGGGGGGGGGTVHSHRSSEEATTASYGPRREPGVAGRSLETEGTVHEGERSEGRTYQPTPPLPETGPTASPSGGPLPRLEALAEDDDMSALIDGHKHASLDAPAEDFVDLDFEYYDFGGHQEPVTLKPTLPSLSLVSPVPVRVPPRSPEPSRDHATRKPAPARPRKTPPARPIPRSNPQRPLVRNNPYPYGPKRLPGPYAPLRPNLPHTRDSSRERLLTEYNYEDDQDYYYDSEEEEEEEEGGQEEPRFEVQTKEPAVLFVFDKPGYSPEPPTTMVPPTRSPTPSDPWDCSPRCPRYTLLDWNMDYDVRQYPETLWVSTVIISDNRVLAELEGYMRVQDYFYGLNDQGLLLNLTVPFVTQVKFGKHPGVLQETNDYTVSLYVQPAYYRFTELPTPISNEVLVDELEAKTVFVHSFEANVWDVTEAFLEAKVTNLMQQLRHNGEAFLDRYYYLASYSRPELYQTVYYEVWIYATNFRDPQTSAKTSTPHRRPQTNKITQKTLSKLCRGVECPKFEVLRTYKYGIQKRRYYDGLFASSSPKECQFTTMSVWKGFMPLHLYKHGINSHMEVIEATRPIALVHVRDSTSPATECPQNLTMSLYLPHRLHSNPPVTGYAAPSVHITAMDDVIVYAYTVGGYLLEPARVRQELSDLKYRLSEFGACYKDDEHFVVIYDFIVRYHGRQNEIWIVAENCKATHNG